jgi:predicted RNase H-like nuclease (RuvC/YqgF family)
MENLNIKALLPEEINSFSDYCAEKVNVLKFQLLKISRRLSKQREKIQNWQNQIRTYQERIETNKKILELLPETRAECRKFRLDVLKSDIRIDTLQIRINKYSQINAIENQTKILALQAQIQYFEELLIELDTARDSKRATKKDIEVKNTLSLPLIDFLSTSDLFYNLNKEILGRYEVSYLLAS